MADRGSKGKSASKDKGGGSKKYGRDIAKKLRMGRAYKGSHKKDHGSVKESKRQLGFILMTHPARWMGPAYQL